jgi:hypothetical protein
MRLRSLELNWLRNFDRTLPIPEVMFYPLQGCAGKYYHPHPSEMYDADGHPYERHRGVIVVSPKFEEFVAANIAHEWRHHWQYYQGMKFEIPKKDLFKKLDYEDALLQYFTTSKTEMDALRFEHWAVGVHEYWEEVLFDFLKDIRPRKIWV